MTDQAMFFAICEAIEKLEVIEPYWPGDDMRHEAVLAALKKVKEELRARL